jgi:hypothetical protein
MYTDAMRQAVHSLDNYKPKGFGLTIRESVVEGMSFLTVVIDAMSLTKMSVDDKLKAAEYIARIKFALEDNGAIVQLVREALD